MAEAILVNTAIAKICWPQASGPVAACRVKMETPLWTTEWETYGNCVPISSWESMGYQFRIQVQAISEALAIGPVSPWSDTYKIVVSEPSASLLLVVGLVGLALIGIGRWKRG